MHPAGKWRTSRPRIDREAVCERWCRERLEMEEGRTHDGTQTRDFITIEI